MGDRSKVRTDIEMGCGSSTESTDGNNNDKKPEDDDMADPEDEQINIEDTEQGYPPPRPPRSKKADVFRLADFAHVDKRAKETPLELTNSWQDLIDYLLDGCKTDLERLRSIFVWLGTLDFTAVPVNNDPESLQGYIRVVKSKKVSYAVFFTRLCRIAKLPCVLIRGHGKSAAYEVGDTIDRVRQLYNIWTAVYVDGDWRFVIPYWAYRGVVGHSTGKYTLVETKGTAARSVESASEGKLVSTMNEHYFLTDPEELVVVLMAEDSKWQLLQIPYTIDKFCSIPFLRQSYFQYHLMIKDEFNGCKFAKDGVCDFVIASDLDSWKGHLDYALYFNHAESKDKIPDELQLDKYVIMIRQSNTWTFLVRFPVGGVYKMSIYGGPNINISNWICDYKLVCDSPKENVQPLPCNPGLLGFGPTQELETAGLSAPSHANGIVIIKRNQQYNFNFTMKRKVSIRTELVHNEINTQVLQQYVTQKIENKKLHVDINVPQDGEYALRMYAKNKETNTEDNVCNYLLTSDDPRRKKRTRENPTEKRARENLKAIMDSTKSPTEIEEAIEKCNKLRLDDKGDLSKAYERKTFLQLQKDLRDAINRRHIETLEKAISNAKESDFSNDLSSDVEKAENVLEHLRRLKGFLHDILELKQTTVSEIRSYNIAQPITYHVMKATYLLLGAKEDDIESWELVKILIGQLGRYSLINQIKKFDFEKLKPETVKAAQSTIQNFDKQTAQKVSAGVGTFYVWCHDVCDEYNRTHS